VKTPLRRSDMARVLKGTLEALGHTPLLAQQNILSLYNNQHGSQN